MTREVRWEEEGAAPGEYGYSSLKVRRWWMLTINSHAVEFSIASCVEEMVRDPNLMPFSFLFFFSFYFFFIFFFMCFVLSTTGNKD